jgi:hypothetical protein
MLGGVFLNGQSLGRPDISQLGRRRLMSKIDRNLFELPLAHSMYFIE